MQIDADISNRKVSIDLPERVAGGDFFAEAKAQAAFMVTLADRPEPFEVYAFTLTAPGFEMRFSARVVQILAQGDDRFGVVFQLTDWGEAKDLELKRKLAAPVAGGAGAEGDAAGVSPIFRIKGLDPAEKARLALKANRAERQILVRDSSPQILLSLLGNPRIEATDVLQIVKSTHANAGILQRVASDRRWASNSEIQTAIVRNPKTPPPIAIKLLEYLPIRELRDMAKIGSLRENVRRAAFRVYQKRSGR